MHEGSEFAVADDTQRTCALWLAERHRARLLAVRGAPQKQLDGRNALILRLKQCWHVEHSMYVDIPAPASTCVSMRDVVEPQRRSHLRWPPRKLLPTLCCGVTRCASVVRTTAYLF